MKENYKTTIRKLGVRTFVLSQGFIALGVLTHMLNKNYSVALADEIDKSVNYQQNQNAGINGQVGRNNISNEKVTQNNVGKVNQNNTVINSDSQQNNVQSTWKPLSKASTELTTASNERPSAQVDVQESVQSTWKPLPQVSTQSATQTNPKPNSEAAVQESWTPLSSTNVQQNSQKNSAVNSTQNTQTFKSQDINKNHIQTKPINAPTASPSIDNKTSSKERTQNTRTLMTSSNQNLNENKVNTQNIVSTTEKTPTPTTHRPTTFAAFQPRMLVATNTSTNKIDNQKAYNDAQLRKIKTNTTFKARGEQIYEGIASIRTDKAIYKPGETIKIYTEYNKYLGKPIYHEAGIAWYMGDYDAPYYFDDVAIMERTNKFYRNSKGNWESLVEIKLPKKMVDNAFNININSWGEENYVDYYDDNGIVIKVLNSTSTYKLGGYDLSAFGERLKDNDVDYTDPKIIKFSTDKKVYNPNDTVTLTVELKEVHALTYVNADMTFEPTSSDGYISMEFKNFTRDFKKLANGNWQAKITFKLPSYMETGYVELNDIGASDIYANNITPYNGGITLFKVEKTKNAQLHTVNAISDASKSISGKATSGLDVYAYANSKQIGHAKATNGKYTMSIPKQVANTKIQVYTVNKYNSKSKAVTTTVLDKTPPKKPTATKISTKSITGTGEKGSTIYIYNGSAKIGSAVINSKGSYTINYKMQKKGTALTVYAIDKAKNKSSKLSIKVK